MEFILTEQQYKRAVEIGSRRQEAALERKRPSAHGYDERAPLDVHIQGAAAELGISLITGLEWHAFLEHLPTERKPPDVGADLQVRSTEYRSGHLICHPGDSEEDRFILVHVNGRKLQIKGWLRGSEAKQEKYWGDKFKNGRPAYWIPQRELHPIDQLLKGIPGNARRF
jgi:hypothetical protein